MEEVDFPVLPTNVPLFLRFSCPDKSDYELFCLKDSMKPAPRSDSPDRPSLWTVYDETKKLLEDFKDSCIRSTRRESNRVADVLAKLARSAGSCIWTRDPPGVVQHLVNQDFQSMM